MIERAEVEKTLEKYRKNKTLVAPEDLEGKYKVPFEKLKQQLKTELEEYLYAFFHFEQLTIRQDDKGKRFIEQINQTINGSDYGKRVGWAVFKEFDLEQAERITEAEGHRIFEGIYTEYFNKYTCARAPAECWDIENPKTPRIYNDLVDKYYDEATGRWITDEAESKKPAILIFVNGDKEGKKE